jgi:hypothetical protein
MANIFKQRRNNMSTIKPKQWDVVEITWMDACGPHLEGMTLEDAVAWGPIKRYTIGYLIAYTSEKIVFAETDDRESKEMVVAEVITAIPVGMILNVSVLRRGSRA